MILDWDKFVLRMLFPSVAMSHRIRLSDWGQAVLVVEEQDAQAVEARLSVVAVSCA